LTAPGPEGPPGPGLRLLRRVVEVRSEEVPALLWSGAYFFALLAAYFVIRPLREEMGVAGGVANLPWLFTGTLVAMLLVHPPFAALVARLPRRRFVAVAYRFFLANLLAFFALRHLLPAEQQIWLGRVFFVWTSVFNLFVVSVFWGFMADVFTAAQGTRLFGFISVGGTLGGLAGSTLTAVLATRIGPTSLLLLSAALLEAAAQCAGRLGRVAARMPRPAGAPPPPPPDAVIGGSALAGISHVARSPYLLGICAYMLLFTVGSTVLYFQQAGFASALPGPAERTAFFARLEQYVQVLTLLVQAFLTGRIIRLLGVTATLALLPALSIAGFTALGAAHTLAVFVAFQVLRRAGEFAVAKPTREVLYTVMSREDKFKAKHLIDTFVYRAGDQAGAWSYALIAAAGVGAAGIAFLAAPFAVVWLGIAVWLGRRHERAAAPA
jgi:ATP:ADP antiporter, AAA family